MGITTGISWTDATWPITWGCSRVIWRSEPTPEHPGGKVLPGACDHCYAFAFNDRMYAAHTKGKPVPSVFHHPFSEVRILPERLGLPLTWRKPRRVFVDSMSDLFHEKIPDDFLAQVFGVMAVTPHITYQILTKRPERMRDWVNSISLQTTQYPNGDMGAQYCINAALRAGVLAPWANRRLPAHLQMSAHWPLPNVWLGVSVEHQRAADERIPHLLQTPATVRFLSCEPLLEPLDLSAACKSSRGRFGGMLTPDWVIVGGESGRGYRPMDLDWARDLRDQCQRMRIPFFYKQGSGPRPGMNPTLDGMEWHQFPDVGGAV